MLLKIIVRSRHDILKHASGVPRGDTGLVTYKVDLHVCQPELTLQSKVFGYTTCVAIVHPILGRYTFYITLAFEFICSASLTLKNTLIFVYSLKFYEKLSIN